MKEEEESEFSFIQTHEGDFPIYQSRFLDFSDLFHCLFTFSVCMCVCSTHHHHHHERKKNYLYRSIHHALNTPDNVNESVICVHTLNFFFAHIHIVCIVSSLFVVIFFLLRFLLFFLLEQGGRSMKKKERTYYLEMAHFHCAPPISFYLFIFSFIQRKQKKGERNSPNINIYIENVFQYIFMHNVFNNRFVVCCVVLTDAFR